jgi:hypothetical protein
MVRAMASVLTLYARNKQIISKTGRAAPLRAGVLLHFGPTSAESGAEYRGQQLSKRLNNAEEITAPSVNGSPRAGRQRRALRTFVDCITSELAQTDKKN